MHPALRQYVERPSPRTARYVLAGAVTGFAGIALAFAIVHVVETRRENDRQTRIDRRHHARDTRAATAHEIVYARALMRDLTVHGWPSWVLAHPDTACPTKLAEFAPYVGETATIDPWGSPFAFHCAGARLVVSSDGPDRRRGTADDVRSAR